jgi:hypothetical protein
MSGFRAIPPTQARKTGKITGRAKYRKAIVPSTIKTICTEVVLVPAAALDGTGGSSLPGKGLTGVSSVPVEESRGLGIVEGSVGCFISMLALPSTRVNGLETF